MAVSWSDGGHQFGIEQFVIPFGFDLAQLQRRLGAGQIPFRLRHRGLVAWTGRVRATTWSAFTGEFQSAYSFWMFPEIWLPTVTFVTGSKDPVAVTAWMISPRRHILRLVLRLPTIAILVTARR